MDRLFDDLARIVGARTPRRRMLRAAAGLLVGAALSGVRPRPAAAGGCAPPYGPCPLPDDNCCTYFDGSQLCIRSNQQCCQGQGQSIVVCPSTWSCCPPSGCCPPDQSCNIDPADGKTSFCCPKESKGCGSLCCPATYDCVGTACLPPCEPGTHRCGNNKQNCCRDCDAGSVTCNGACVPACTGGAAMNPDSCECECPPETTACKGTCLGACDEGLVRNPDSCECECSNGQRPTRQPGSIRAVCCAGSLVPCGDSCCAQGEVCNRQFSRCCPAGSVPCGDTCCGTAAACNTRNGVCCGGGGVPCGNSCCSPDRVCKDREGGACCRQNEAACGHGCCPPEQQCLTPGTALLPPVCCPKGKRPCGSLCIGEGAICCDSATSAVCPKAAICCGADNCCDKKSHKCVNGQCVEEKKKKKKKKKKH